MAEAVLPASERPVRPLWRNISFMLMWSSVAASGFGDRMIELAAMPMLGVAHSGADAAHIQSGIYFFFFLPYLIMTPLGGWLADTLSRKWIMFSCDQLRALVLLGAFLMAPVGAAAEIPPEHHWKVYLILMAVGAMAATFGPSRGATIPQIVPLQHLQSANAIVLGIAVISSLIGFGIGGWILTSYSVRVGLLVAMVCFFVSGWFFPFLRIRQHETAPIGPRQSQWRRMLQAAGYIRRHRSVRQLVGLGVLFWAAANVLVAAMASLCKNQYGFGDDEVIRAYAMMMMFMGLGMLSSSLGVAWMNTRREAMPLAMLGLALAGLCIAAMGFNQIYVVGMILGAVIGFCGNTAMIIVETLIQSLTPNYIRGRVFGVRDMCTMVSAVAVHFVIWRLPNADSLMIPTLYVVALVLAAVGIVGFLRMVSRGPLATARLNFMWRLDRFYCLVWHRLRWVGRENVPSTGSVILAANHTIAIDPFLIQAPLPRLIRWVMIKDYEWRLFRPAWQQLQPIVLDLQGKDFAKIKTMVQVARSGAVVGLFPEGRLQREHRKLGEYQAGIGLVAARSGAWIVPVWVSGTVRHKGMFWHFFRRSQATVTFGRPYRPDPKAAPEQIAADLRNRTVALAQSLGEQVEFDDAGGASTLPAADSPT